MLQSSTVINNLGCEKRGVDYSVQIPWDPEKYLSIGQKTLAQDLASNNDWSYLKGVLLTDLSCSTMLYMNWVINYKYHIGISVKFLIIPFYFWETCLIFIWSHFTMWMGIIWKTDSNYHIGLPAKYYWQMGKHRRKPCFAILIHGNHREIRKNYLLWRMTSNRLDIFIIFVSNILKEGRK